MKVLVVDDQKVQSDILKHLLGLQYKVLVATTKEKALDFLEKESGIQVVLLSSKLAGQSTFGFLQEIIKYNPCLELVFYSDKDDILDAIKAVKLGAFGYVVTPFQSEALEIMVARAATQSRLIQKIQNMFSRVLDEGLDVRSKISIARELIQKRRHEGQSVSKLELLSLFRYTKDMTEDQKEEFWDMHDSVQALASFSLDPIHILMVEDKVLVAKTLIKALQPYYQVHWVKSQAELSLAMPTLPSIDIVLLDIFLPDANGKDLLPILKQRYPDCEVIVMTAFQISDIAVDVLKNGAWMYLNKPFKVEDLLQKISGGLQVKALKSMIQELEFDVIQKIAPLHHRMGMAREFFKNRQGKNEDVLGCELLLFMPELKSHILNSQAPIDPSLFQTFLT